MPRNYVGTELQANGSRVLTELDAFTVGAAVLDPSGARNITIWQAPFACQVQSVRARRRGGTGATVNARKNSASAHLSSNLSLGTADVFLDGGTVQNASYALDDELEIQVVSLAGGVTEVTFRVVFIRL